MPGVEVHLLEGQRNQTQRQSCESDIDQSPVQNLEVYKCSPSDLTESEPFCKKGRGEMSFPDVPEN